MKNDSVPVNTKRSERDTELPPKTKQDREEKTKYDEQNKKIAFGMNMTGDDSDTIKIMVMDHVEGI